MMLTIVLVRHSNDMNTHSADQLWVAIESMFRVHLNIIIYVSIKYISRLMASKGNVLFGDRFHDRT